MKTKLGDIASYVNGYAFKPSDWSNEGAPIIRIQDLTGNSYQMNRYNGNIDSKYEVLEGDILISWSASLGIYVWKGEKSFLNQHIFKVILDEKHVLKPFYIHQVEYILEKAGSQAHGATMKHLTRPVFNALPFYLPDLEVQKRIADELECISDLIDKHEQQLNALDELVKSRFLELFGDPVSNPMGWIRKTLQQLVTVEPQNGLYKPQSDYVQDKSGVPILRIDAFYNGKVTSFENLKRLVCSDTEKERYLLKENDIVINRVNSIEYLGKCAHISGMLEDTVFESNMMRFHLDEEQTDAVFITHLLCSKYIYNQILRTAKKAVNQASINQKDVLGFEIYVPPLELQQQFAVFVAQVDKSKHFSELEVAA